MGDPETTRRDETIERDEVTIEPPSSPPDVESMDHGGRLESYEESTGYPEDPGDIDRPPPPEESLSPAIVSCVDYGRDGITKTRITDVRAFFAEARPEGTAVRWINVVGDPPAFLLEVIAERYHLHPLALEDLIQIPQRPKVDEYAEFSDHPYLFVTTRAVDEEDGHLRSQQVSMFLGERQVISFHQYDPALWQPLLTRLEDAGSRLRQSGTDFLFYCLLDRIVDEVFPSLQDIGERLDTLDRKITDEGDEEAADEVHEIKRALLVMRRELWPMRELLGVLCGGTWAMISKETRTYLRDVHDHSRHLADTVEIYREATTGMLAVYQQELNQKMNEVMKVLTIIATIFIPLSFLTGLFGMNFNKSLPGMDDSNAFTWFIVGCGVVAVTMLGVFRWRKWL
jgi:magnesium transporter